MIDLFSTRTMLVAIELLKPVRRFLLDNFFPRGQAFNTESVDIDIYKGGRKMAPFVHPNHEGKVIQRKGFATRSYKPPYIKPFMVTTAADMLKRQMGETIYGATKTPMERAAEQVAQDLSTLDEMIIRREEWMAARSLQDGKLRVIGDGIDDTVDFLMSSDNKISLTGNAKWSDAANSKPLDDLQSWKSILNKAGYNGSDVVMSSVAWKYFFAANQVSGSSGKKSPFDMSRILLGEINPRDMVGGVQYKGRLTEIGVDIYTYEEWFEDEFDNNTLKPIVDDGRVLMLSRGVRSDILYGAIQDLEANGAVPRFPTSWIEKNPSRRYVMLQSAPLTVPHDIDSTVSAMVI
jgi:hypothetical protein